jgi:hypothetical protein
LTLLTSMVTLPFIWLVETVTSGVLRC